MNYTIGQVVKGKITGIQPYGAFVALEDGTVGLVHISEISDKYVSNINYYVQVNEIVELKVVDIDHLHNQLRLSLKALKNGSVRKNAKRKYDVKLPPSKLGFKTISDNLERWIKEAQQND